MPGYRDEAEPCAARNLHADCIVDGYTKTAPPMATDGAGEAGGLARASAERERDVAPGVEVGGGGRQVQDDATD